ncbi:MAG: DUF4870 domain-containing protein [Flavobacterium sp.]|nr:DUF4870 domain-containing protein [Flavobacterium sp.]
MSTQNENNTATALHLSALSQYLIPFGNFIFPIIIWSSSKDKSNYVDNQGKQCINFHLSIFTYTLLLGLIALTLIIILAVNGAEFHHFGNGSYVADEFNHSNVPGIVATAIVTGVLFVLLLAAQFFLTIYAAVKTSNGADFKYPLTIPFLKYKTVTVENDIINQDVVENEA